jgi:hypothetical protein
VTEPLAIIPGEQEGAATVPPSLDQAREFIRASKAASTLRGYQSGWRDFIGWCQGHSACALPASPETVASYIAECASRLKVGSIQRRLNAIAEAHKAAGLESPTHSGMVRNTLKGIRRTLGTSPAQKTAALIDDNPSNGRRNRCWVDRTAGSCPRIAGLRGGVSAL